MRTPTSFAFGAGKVFAGDGGTEGAARPDGGVFLVGRGRATRLAGSPDFVAGLAWRRGTLYISSATVTATGETFQLLAWSGFNGTSFTRRRQIYTAPPGFDGFNGVAFGADGRLYVGVDVGLTNGNDHGPASTPYLYDILSLKPNGTDLRVFASGMRQPWQLAFPRGSSSPFVSDLGQDEGAAKPPDFLLRVRRGQNYGFPACNWTALTVCHGFAKPFKTFRPHTDVMGVGILGKRLYLSEFLGHRGGSGLVVSMPIGGGRARPFIGGFDEPVVGLGVHDGWVYVGQRYGGGDGLVFRVRA